MPRKVNLTSNQHLQPPHPAMCPSETSKVVPSLYSQRDLRERRDFNQSSTNMKLFSLPEHFITRAAPFGPHVSLNCRIAFFSPVDQRAIVHLTTSLQCVSGEPSPYIRFAFTFYKEVGVLQWPFSFVQYLDNKCPMKYIQIHSNDCHPSWPAFQ